MLKTMKSEMLTITQKKNPDISVLHVYSQTLITGGTTQQNIKPWKADFWETRISHLYCIQPPCIAQKLQHAIQPTLANL